MAIFYVSPTGSDSAAGTSAAPFATFSRANGASAVGDEIRAKAGTYPGGISPKTGRTYAPDAGAAVKIDCAINGASAGFAAVGVKDIVIKGLEVCNASTANITLTNVQNLKILNCHVHDCLGNGISINSDCDIIEIDGNHVHHCATTNSANSGISVLMPKADTSYSALAGGHGVRVTNNIVHDCGRMTQKDADGNGIIIDKFHWLLPESARYTRTTLVSGNLVYNNASCGIKAMASQNLTIEFNTCYGNKQRTPAVTTAWMGEISMQQSANNIIRDNILQSTVDAGAAYTNVNWDDTSATISSNLPLPKNGHTYARNIIFTSVGRTTWATAGGVAPTTPGDYTNANPKLTSPATGDFSLAAGSPATGQGAGGKNIGWYQTPVVPTPDVTITAAPALTVTKAESGSSFSLAIGTYSATATVTRQAQLYYNNKWNDVAVSMTGTTTLTGTLPDVASRQGFRVLETFTGQGVTNGKNPSNWIDIDPAAITPTDLNDVILLVDDLSARVGTLEVNTSGLGARMTAAETTAGLIQQAVDTNALAVSDLDARMTDAEASIAAFQSGGGGGGGGRKIAIADIIGPVSVASPEQKAALRTELEIGGTPSGTNATAQDIITGTDTSKIVTAAAVGGALTLTVGPNDRAVEAFGAVAVSHAGTVTQAVATANLAAIHAAIDWSNATGGRVRFGYGIYWIWGALKAKSNIVMEGQGGWLGHTVIKQMNPAWPDVLASDPSTSSTTGAANVGLRGLCLDGGWDLKNSAGSGANWDYLRASKTQRGIFLDAPTGGANSLNRDDSSDTNHQINDVWVRNVAGRAIHLSGRGECVLDRIRISKFATDGLYLGAPDNWVSNVTCQQGGDIGINVASGDQRLSNIKAWFIGMCNGEEVTGAGFTISGAGVESVYGTNITTQDTWGPGMYLQGRANQISGGCDEPAGGRLQQQGFGWAGTRTRHRECIRLGSCYESILNLGVHGTDRGLWTIGSTDAPHLVYMDSGASGNFVTINLDRQKATKPWNTTTPVAFPAGYTSNKRWNRIEDQAGGILHGSMTTAQLTDIAHAVNVYKTEGMAVLNSTTGVMVRASGTGAAATWVDMAGTLAHTPV